MSLKPLYVRSHSRHLNQMLQTAAGQFGNRDAFRTVEGRRISFSQFRSDVDALASALDAAGVKPETRIAILGKNSYPWAVSYFAATAGGWTAVPLDPALPGQELARLLQRSRAGILFFDPEYAERVHQIQSIPQMASLLCISMEHCPGFLSLQDMCRRGTVYIKKQGSRLASVTISSSAAAVILFTSGTTSRSKGVILSHHNLCANVYAFTRCVGLTEQDIHLSFLPYYHTYGAMAGLLSMVSCGVCSTFTRGLKSLRADLIRSRATVFMSVPLLIERLYKKSPSLLADSSLRLIMSGGSPADPKITDALNQMGILTTQIYGLTETSPGITIETERSRRSGSVGKALPGVSIRIDHPNEQGIGEILVQSPGLMTGYVEDPDATGAVICQGWFHTGDLGRMDADGYLFLTGRKRNVIVLKSGKNIFPEELELLINRLPYVKESLVCGVPRHSHAPDDLTLCCKLVYDAGRLAVMHPGKEMKTAVQQDIDRINDTLPVFKQIKRLIITETPMERTAASKIKRYKEDASLSTASNESAVRHAPCSVSRVRSHF